MRALTRAERPRPERPRPERRRLARSTAEQHTLARTTAEQHTLTRAAVVLRTVVLRVRTRVARAETRARAARLRWAARARPRATSWFGPTSSMARWEARSTARSGRSMSVAPAGATTNSSTTRTAPTTRPWMERAIW